MKKALDIIQLEDNRVISYSHKFDDTIIRSYDIRGVYNETLFETDAIHIGRLFGLKVGKKRKVNICCDGRLSSPSLKKNLIKGLLEVGVDVCDIGIGPTPLLYFSCYENNASGGIMITGSHNPKNHNGFKFVLENMPFYGEDLLTLSNKANDYHFNSKKGCLVKANYKAQYLSRIFKNFEIKKKLRIVWDAGNGSAGELMSQIAQKVNKENILLFDDIDGNFPNHHPDPSDVKNLKDCIDSIIEEKLDLGIAFDGDGDRIGVVDDRGRPIPGDKLLLLFSKDILLEKKCTIIGDVKCSQVLFDEIEKDGGKAIISKTGHSHVKESIKKNKADLAGEMSGHIFFNLDYFGFDDALYSAIKLLKILDKRNKKLSELIDELPSAFNTPEIRIGCNDSEKFNLIKQIISSQKQKNNKIIDIDGIRVVSDSGWWLLRASNTQAELVLRCEADSKKNLKKQLLFTKDAISEFNLELSDKILVENYI